MKILVALTLILVLAVGSLGYLDYRQVRDIKLLQSQMSDMTQEVVAQHEALISHKKAILALRSSQKESDKAVVTILLFLRSLESDSSPEPEQNSYTKSTFPCPANLEGHVTGYCSH